jgi:hypothetical protein
MRAILVVALILTATVTLAAPASADHHTVGKCELACAAVCIADADTRCGYDARACVGISLQVPQCVG